MLPVVQNPVAQLVMQPTHYGTGFVREEKRKKRVNKTGDDTNKKSPRYGEGVKKVAWIAHSYFLRMFGE